jgi:hypothetical protein
MGCVPATRSTDRALTFIKNMTAAIHTVAGVVIEFLIMAGVLAALIAVGATRQRGGRWGRPDALKDLAMRLEFDRFEAAPNKQFAMGWGFLSRLDSGTERYAFNILQGKYHETRLFVFDYHYQISEGKNADDRYLTIFMLVCKEAFPILTIRPEHLYDKIAGAIGLENEIKFESAEFSRTFNVRSSDKKFAYDVCNAQMIEFLLANRDLQIEINGPVISMAFEPQLPVEKVEFNLQRLAQIHSLLPQYLFTNA